MSPKTANYTPPSPKSRKQWIYLYHEYDILMDQQANTAADAIVIIASGFSVPEVSAGIDVDPDSGFLSRRFDAPLFTTHTVDKRRRTDKKNIVSYRHHRYQLIHSPYVMKVYKTLIRIRNSAIAKLNALAAHFQAGPATAWVAKSGLGFANMINDFSFLQAKTLLDGLGATILSPYRKEVSAISADLAYGDLLLVLVQFRQDDEVGLLNGYLGIDPHVSRKKAQKLLSELEARERKRKIEEMMRIGGIEMW